MNYLLSAFLISSALLSPAAAQSWEAISSGTSANITGVSFFHPDTGHFVTQTGQLGVTFDAGKTWQLLTIAPDVAFEDVYFVGRDTGMVCGRGGRIFRTTDGGRTWEDHSLTSSVPWFLSVHMSSGQQAVVLGMTREKESPMRGLSLYTEDGGETWQHQESHGLAYGEIFERANGDLYHQSWGKLHLSKDRGRTWRSTETEGTKPGRATAIFGTTGIRAGNNGMCMVSTDNGKSWKPAIVRSDCHYTSIVMIDEQHAFLGGTENALLETTDAGESWKSQTLPTPFDIYDMARAGEYVIAVGSDGNIVRHSIRQ